MLVGQAPGAHEESLGKPFAHTAGKTLFNWLKDATGASEGELRQMISFSAIARCYPGKSLNGQGDRVPSQSEIENCREHLRSEIEILRPKLILAVGKLAIKELLGDDGPLENFVGKKFKVVVHGCPVEVLPLPHPSGVSRWPHSKNGKKALRKALIQARESLAALI